MKLWAFVHRALIEAAIAKGRAVASWEHVNGSWRPAYRWMVERMRERGLVTQRGRAAPPPIWAWHSQHDKWQSPPDWVTVEGLLTSEPHNWEGIYMLALEIPGARVLLSRYWFWGKVLDSAIAGKDPAQIPARGVIYPPCGDRARSPRWWDPRTEVQACIAALHREDIVAIEPLPTKRSRRPKPRRERSQRPKRPRAGELSAMLRQGRAEQLLALADRAFAADSHDPWVFDTRARVYESLGRYDEALASTHWLMRLPRCRRPRAAIELWQDSLHAQRGTSSR